MKAKKEVNTGTASVFFEYDRSDDSYQDWQNIEVRACPNDPDFPIEVCVEMEEGLVVGIAFTKADILRFVAEAYGLGVI